MQVYADKPYKEHGAVVSIILEATFALIFFTMGFLYFFLIADRDNAFLRIAPFVFLLLIGVFFLYYLYRSLRKRMILKDGILSVYHPFKVYRINLEENHGYRGEFYPRGTRYGRVLVFDVYDEFENLVLSYTFTDRAITDDGPQGVIDKWSIPLKALGMKISVKR